MSTTTHCVLFVDDEPNMRHALARAMRKEPYALHFACSGESALKVMAEQDIHLVVSDQVMPGMMGLDLLDEIRRRSPSTMRIILTGYADLETAIGAINRGEIYRFLTKPWENTDLRVTIRLALAHHDLQKENQELLGKLKRQALFLRRLEETYPGIATAGGSDGPVVVTPSELGSQ